MLSGALANPAVAAGQPPAAKPAPKLEITNPIPPETPAPDPTPPKPEPGPEDPEKQPEDKPEDGRIRAGSGRDEFSRDPAGAKPYTAAIYEEMAKASPEQAGLFARQMASAGLIERNRSERDE